MNVSKELLAWLVGHDTGRSSLTMVSRNLGLPIRDSAWSYPCDADDFGRCYRLLETAPEIKIEKMKGFNRIWDDLVDVWQELTDLYEQFEGSGIYRKIHQITEKYSKNHCTLSEDILY